MWLTNATTVTNQYIRYNTFSNSTDWGVRYYNLTESALYTVDSNCYWESSGFVARIGTTEYDYATEWEDYKTDSSQDANSTASSSCNLD